MTPQLAAWLDREHARICALDDLSDRGVDVARLRLIRRLVERGVFTDHPAPRNLPT